MTATPYDYSSGSRGAQLVELGRLVGYNGDGSGIYVPLSQTFSGQQTQDPKPGPPTLDGSMTTRTSAQLSWTQFSDPATMPPIEGWELERRSSTDGGFSFGPWAAGSGSPFPASTLSLPRTGLPTGTPEVVFEWRVRGFNSAGEGEWSNEKRLQYGGNPVGQLPPISGFNDGAVTDDSVQFTWLQPTADASETKRGIFVGDTLTVDNIGATATSFLWSGLPSETTYVDVNVRRWNGQWSPSSEKVTVTTLQPPNPSRDPADVLIGVSDDGGSSTVGPWALWRSYNSGNRDTKLALAATQAVFYSEDGPNLGGANPNYNTIFNHVLDELDAIYYNGVTSRGVGGTHSSNWGKRLYWLNGNENFDKGAAPGSTNWTQAQIDAMVLSQKALYDACHYAPGGVRRYPDAKAATNPTQEQERKGWVAAALHPMARYCDAIIWSAYMPGRGVNDTTLSRYPRLDWPSFNEADRTALQPGWAIRPFYRTFQAQAAARTATGDPNFSIEIGIGEFGFASNPDDRTQRPYFAVHGCMGAFWILAGKYGLTLAGACWWSGQTGSTAPHDYITDEQPNCDHIAQGTGAARGANSTAANPQTWVALRNWYLYDKRIAGSSQPAQWAGNPQQKVTTQSLRDGTHWYSTGTPV